MGKTTAIIVVLAVGISVSAYFTMRAMQPKESDKSPFAPESKPTAETKIGDVVKQILVRKDDDSFPLKKGKRGSNVKAWQQWLMDKKFSLGSYGADGIFGQVTETATRQAIGKNEVSPEDFTAYTTGAKRLPIPYADNGNATPRTERGWQIGGDWQSAFA